jgi:hypothetical protein
MLATNKHTLGCNNIQCSHCSCSWCTKLLSLMASARLQRSISPSTCTQDECCQHLTSTPSCAPLVATLISSAVCRHMHKTDATIIAAVLCACAQCAQIPVYVPAYAAAAQTTATHSHLCCGARCWCHCRNSQFRHATSSMLRHHLWRPPLASHSVADHAAAPAALRATGVFSAVFCSSLLITHTPPRLPTSMLP